MSSGASKAGLSLDVAVQSGAWDAVMQIMNQDWAELLSTHPEALLEALGALPEDVVSANPRWAMARTYVSRITSGDAASASRYRHSAIPEKPVAFMDSLAELTSRTAAHRAAGRFSEAASLAQQARAVLADADDDALREVQPALPEFHQQWGMAREFAGDVAGAIRDYTDAYDHAVINRHPIVQLNAAGSLAWIHTLAGRGTQAAAWLGRLSTGASEGWWTGRHAVPARLAEAYALIDDLRYDDARAFLDAHVDVDQYPEYWAAKPMLQAMVARDEHEALALLVALDAQTAGAPSDLISRGTSGGMYRLTRSALLARAGQVRDALRELDAAELDRGTFLGQLLLCARGCLELLVSSYSEASRLSGELRSTATDSPRILATALLTSAVAAMRLDAPSQAAVDFRSAALVATTHGILSAFITFSRSDMRDLVAVDPTVLPGDLEERILANGRKPLQADGFARLSPREMTVVSAVLSTPSVAAAAAALFVSPNTVKTQLRSIYSKLGVTNRRQLEAAASRRNRGGRGGRSVEPG